MSATQCKRPNKYKTCTSETNVCNLNWMLSKLDISNEHALLHVKQIYTSQIGCFKHHSCLCHHRKLLHLTITITITITIFFSIYMSNGTIQSRII